MPTGCIREDSTYFATKDSLPFEISKSTILAENPSLKPYCPTPGSQGNCPSCVGFAVAYALTIEKAKRGVDIDDHRCLEEIKYSPCFLYNAIRDKKNGGAKLSKALNFIVDTGICKSYDFPDCILCKDLNKDTLAKLPKVQCEKYLRLFNEYDTEAYKLQKVKYILSIGKPIVLALDPQLGIFPNEEAFWHPARLGNYQSKFLHAVVGIGYDSTGIEMLNSYGPDWGKGGFFKMKDKALARQAAYAYSLCLSDTIGCGGKGNPSSEKLYAYFSLYHKRDGSLAEVQMKRMERNQYAPIKKNWHERDWFKLAVEEVPQHTKLYLYLLTSTPENQSKLLQEFKPTEFNDSLEIDDLYFEKGTDNLILLVSKNKIVNVNQKAEAIHSYSGTLRQKMYAAFDIPIEDEATTHFSSNKLMSIADPELNKSGKFIIVLSMPIVD